MTIEGLRTDMQAGFKKVGEEFVAVRAEMAAGFKRVDAEFVAVRAEMAVGFKRVDEEFVAVRAEMAVGFKRVDEEFVAVRAEMAAGFKAVRTELKAAMKTETETIRRHMDVLLEDMKDVVKVVAEATAHNTLRVNDHDKRLTKLEKRRT